MIVNVHFFKKITITRKKNFGSLKLDKKKKNKNSEPTWTNP